MAMKFATSSHFLVREREIQRERERERERERVRRKWRPVSSAELCDEFCTLPNIFTLVLAKSFAIALCQNLHLSFSPLERRWDHTFRCQKRSALRNSSRSSFCFCQMAWQGIEAPKQTIEFPAAPTFFKSKNLIKLIPKTNGNRKRDGAWGCARRINTTSENLQIEKHKSVRWAERTPSWFVLFHLQIFWGGVYPPSATSRTISSSISNSFWSLHPPRWDIRSSLLRPLNLKGYKGWSFSMSTDGIVLTSRSRVRPKRVTLQSEGLLI